MNGARARYALLLLAVTGPLLAYLLLSQAPASYAVDPQPTPSGHIATPAELAAAQAAWSKSEHAQSFDQGMGANTTCARCKSPRNWDPSQTLAQQQALDCASCKREPGAARPELQSGVPVAEANWHNIGCDICHVPAGDSYYTGIAFWDQATGRYQALESVSELCAHCHEGRHGFQVVEEQADTIAHQGLECTACHGAHGQPAACVDCHDPQSGPGAGEHARHPGVNCTACHDAGGLSIWLDTTAGSRHAGTYIPVRFAHTLTSWPSHDLSRQVNCKRCHHPLGDNAATLVPEVGCDECHAHPDGAVSEWCIYFRRDGDPNATTD